MKLRAIKDKKKIEAIFEKGLLIRGNGVSLRFYDFNNNECFYGVSVPKKIFPLAVERNLVRRRVRELVRLFDEKDKMPLGVSFFLICSNRSILKKADVKKNIGDLLREFIANHDI